MVGTSVLIFDGASKTIKADVISTDPILTQWTQIYGTPPNETAESVLQTKDGGYAIACSNGSTQTVGPMEYEALLIKTDSSGNQLWSNTYNEATNYGVSDAIIQTNDEEYALACSTYSGIGIPTAFLVKINSTGNQLWYNESLICTLGFVVQTSDEGFVLGGSFGMNGFTSSAYIWLNKTDSSGNLVWDKTYGNDSYASSIVQTSDGGYLIASGQYAGNGDASLIKTDSAGNQLWNKTYGNFSSLGGIVKTSDGGYALEGYAYAAGNNDFYLVKVDSLGNVQWNQTFVSSISSIVQTNDGGYLLAMGNMLVKTDSSGTLQWNETFVGVNIACIINTSDGGYALAGGYSDGINSYSWLGKISLSSTSILTPISSPTPTASPAATPTTIPSSTASHTPTPIPTMPSLTSAPAPTPTPIAPEFPAEIIALVTILAVSTAIISLCRKTKLK